MTYKYRKMTIMRLFDFNTEDACEAYLIRVRWPDGLICPHCLGKEFEKREGKTRAYRCVVCHRFLSPTAGTIFHRTRTSLQQWFIALFLVATDKRGLSALFLAEQIGVSYPTAWAMIQRMRHAMAKRDLQYTLSGHVEMDEMFIGSPTEAKKRGRGTEKTPGACGSVIFACKGWKRVCGIRKTACGGHRRCSDHCEVCEGCD